MNKQIEEVLNAQKMEIECDTCKTSATKTVGWVRANKLLKCKCGATIPLHTPETTAVISSARKAIEKEVEKAIKKIAKNIGAEVKKL